MALIFTADDYGAYKEIDDGIITALDKGWLNSVAMLANGHDMKTSIDKILPFQKDKRVDIGCHFTINSGRALSPGMQSNPNFTHEGHFRPFFNMNIGRILKKKNLHQNMSDLKAEIKAQIENLRSKGVDVKHLSSHFNTLHYYPEFLKVQFELLSEDGYRDIKVRSTNIKPKFSSWFLPVGARVATILTGEIDVEEDERIVDYAESEAYVNGINRWVQDYRKHKPTPPMPDVLDGFHYQKIGSLGIGKSTKRRKAQRKSKLILEKVLETYDSSQNFEFVFHLADPKFMLNEASRMSKTQFKDHLNSKYMGVTPNYMDNRHIEFQSLANFDEISELNLDPQAWSKI